MTWTTPAQLQSQTEALWQTGAILRATVAGEALFPRPLRLKRPSPREVADRFGEVRDWIAHLQAASREHRGTGYTLQWRRVTNRVHGANDLPVAAILPSAADAVALIGKSAELQRFRKLHEITLARFPALEPWLARRPLTALAHAGDWERLLDVVAWFAAHPRPDLYLRQFDIAGVHTKFIEGHRPLLSELPHQVLPDAAVAPDATGVRGFERRYGLRRKPVLIPLRLLDEGLYVSGLSDLSAPAGEVARLRLPARGVFIAENEINGLAFPDVPGSVVIFGLGYGLERLSEIPWLGDATLYYWGDIDTHGFAILDRLRERFPHVRSLLMDRATLRAHRDLWVTEPRESRFAGEPHHLREDERSLFEDLRNNRLGEAVRLEQERIAFGWVEEALRSLAGE